MDRIAVVKKNFRLCFCFVLLTSLQTSTSYRPCQISPDLTYTGSLVDCSQTGISSADIGKLVFPNVSSLILSNNYINALLNNSFAQFTKLKRLECDSCSLSVLGENALKGLGNLDLLSLQNNNLKIINRAFPRGFFHRVPRLRILKIGWNGNDGPASNYSDYIDVFDSLHQLSQLEIDSFGTLRIGAEFAKLKNLNSLIIICEALSVIDNNSLLGFNASSVKKFTMLGSRYNGYTDQPCDLLFQSLPNISSLTVANMKFGNMKLMHMLKPLMNWTLDLLHVDNVGLHTYRGSYSERLQDLVISATMVQYLKYVCVAHFVWLNNFAVTMDVSTLVSHQWKRCLKSFTLVTGGTHLSVNKMYWYDFLRLRSIQSIIYMVDLKETAVNFWEQNTPSGISDDVKTKRRTGFEVTELNQESENHHNQEQNCDNIISIEQNIEQIHSVLIISDIFPSVGDTQKEAAFFSGSDVCCGDRNCNKGGLKTPNVTVSIPPFLETLVIDDMNWFRADIRVSGNNTLRSLAFRNSIRGVKLQGPMIGFNQVESLDFTGSKLYGDPMIVKWFPNLRKVYMRDTQNDIHFYLKVSESAYKLEYFDIAENNLQWLPKDAFRSSINLKYLCLSSNRFSRIPFDIGLTPNLGILDLRENALILTQKERQALGQHSLKHGNNFTILLSHNQFSCACSSIFLIKWLQHSNIKFDENGDYTCMTEDGGLSKMSKYSDIEAFWRQCSGKSYVLTSLLIASTLGAFYLGSFLVIMHKTQILSKMKQIVQPMFRLKTREEFDFDVTIGYADQNVDFIRETLLPYLEGELGLRTFVHQRDLLQDPLMMFQAIRDSWRSLLVITEDFLDHYDLAHNVMKACVFFVNVDNPKSLIVLVETTCRTRIPDYVLQVVDEDNIIILPQLSTPGLDYEARETLRTRILR